MPKSFVRARSLAFARSGQGGLCFYCELPMWAESAPSFATKCRITLADAKQFQCTGEHLRALQDGGTILSPTSLLHATIAINIDINIDPRARRQQRHKGGGC